VLYGQEPKEWIPPRSCLLKTERGAPNFGPPYESSYTTHQKEIVSTFGSKPAETRWGPIRKGGGGGTLLELGSPRDWVWSEPELRAVPFSALSILSADCLRVFPLDTYALNPGAAPPESPATPAWLASLTDQRFAQLQFQSAASGISPHGSCGKYNHV